MICVELALNFERKEDADQVIDMLQRVYASDVGNRAHSGHFFVLPSEQPSTQPESDPKEQ